MFSGAQLYVRALNGYGLSFIGVRPTAGQVSSMVRGAPCWAFVLTMACGCAAGTSADDVAGDTATLAQIQQRLAAAWVAGDRMMLERLIAPEWRSTGPDGRLSDRATVLADVFERRVHRIRRLEIDDVRVDLFENVAIVRGRTHGVGDFAGTPYDVRIRFTDTFIRRNSDWQAVASHASLDAGR
jgi:hypothetical protein